MSYYYIPTRSLVCRGRRGRAGRGRVQSWRFHVCCISFVPLPCCFLSTVTTGWRRVDKCVGLTALLGLRVSGSLPLPLALADQSVRSYHAHNRVRLTTSTAAIVLTRWHCNLQFMVVSTFACIFCPPSTMAGEDNPKQPQKNQIS